MKAFEVLETKRTIDQRTLRPKLNITLSIDVCEACSGDSSIGSNIILAINEAMSEVMGENKELLKRM